MACHIRPASAGDCGDIVRMMKELGAYEKHSHGTEVTEEGFTIVGYALYIFSYNSMRGRIIYLEDLYVIPEFRGKGVGKQLLKEVAKIGQDRQCYQIQFAVLNWNQQAIDFYRAQGAIDLTQETGYHIFRFEDAAMTKLAGAEANP
ncbi:diamine acetyltransferase 2 isoform X2 [Microcaecilia unicolor]|uniref:Diamine acetyltransferase 2-like isoform X2 n=1 Tax=Microcaecilia unicolor TaxID=1415580 RepID=A0A6P7WHK9_9AMPH|nr:diamine acetyltransferase 2-like isoform X2 [Microcaecilia unicolor]